MGDEFYAIIKLISGEEILSIVATDDNDGDPVLILQNPVVVKILEGKMGTIAKVKPWMELSNDDFYVVNFDKIITMTELEDINLISIYDEYISDDNKSRSESPGRVKPDSKMGYISSVEDARKRLEDIFKLKDNKES